MAEKAPLLELRNISKRFGKALVLDEVSLAIQPGENVALVGDNGAGKSTLIKIITGVHQPDAGEVLVRGRRAVMRSVAESRALGIEAVYQERALCDQQSMWRNIFAGRERTTWLGFMAIREQKREAEGILRTNIGLTSRAISVDSEVGQLSGGEKQGVAFARALHFDADLVILDEPTMGLSLQETERVLGFVKDLKDRDKSSVFIDHNIFHVYDVADRFIILDRGRVHGQFRKEEISQKDLVDTMVGLHHEGRLQ